MRCWNCGCALSEIDYCTGCGADVKLYKTIIRLSNRYYNEGLDKARVRDLTGAVSSLKQSLRYNKKNIQARNLLGLVYYEMGEAVSALSEWVLSKNMRGKKNIADDYIRAIQANPARLESINQTIKKYNLALQYCKQGSEDLAIIQLKKVLSMNGNLVKGHQLLALLYIKVEEYERARKELKKAIKIDANNTITMRYIQELDLLTNSGPASANISKPSKKEDKIAYKSGNETIIQPTTFKENTGLSTVINIIIGVAVGAALIWLLIMPARIQAVRRETAQEINEYSEQLSAKIASETEIQKQIEKLTAEKTDLQEQIQNYEGGNGIIGAYESLLKAVTAYLNEDNAAASEALAEISNEVYAQGQENFQALYDNISAEVNQKAATDYYDNGFKAYQNNDFETAINDLGRAAQLNKEDVNALYYLGRAHQKNGDKEKAIEILQQVIDLFPTSNAAKDARTNLALLQE